MSNPDTIEPDESEIERLPETEVGTAISVIAKAELDSAVLTARANPRHLRKAINNITSMATLDEDTAEECIYALPRGGKPIRGPSVRLAEIIAQQWGNCRVEAEVIEIDRINKIIKARGTFTDLETNTAVRAPAARRIADKRGRLFNDDMITVTSAAVCSIARRNAILAGVPKLAWRKAYDEAERVIRGDIKTLAENREKAVRAFATYGVKPEQIFTILEIDSLEDVTLDHVVTLRAMYSSIKNGDATVEELFDPRRAGRSFEVVANPLKDDAESVDKGAVKDSTAETAPSGAERSTDSVEKTEPERPVPRPAEGGDLDRPSPGAAAADASREPAAAAFPQFVDPIRVAEQRGRDDRARGMSQKAVPPEFRTADKTALAAAWLKGWNAGG
jgi:hypothetical protein